MIIHPLILVVSFSFNVQQKNLRNIFTGLNFKFVFLITGHFIFIFIGAPEKPTNIILYSGTNYIVVEFQPGFHGGSKQKFILEYRKKLTRHWISHEIKSSNAFYQRYKIEYLHPSTEFELRMFAQNKQGNSSVTKIYCKFTSGRNIIHLVLFFFV